MASLDNFLVTSRLQSKDRGCMTWYGLITLVDPDPFWFDLVIFDAVNAESNTGNAHVFDWDTSQNTLVFRKTTQLARGKEPEIKVLDVDLKIWPEEKTLAALKAPLVEAFLDEWHRQRILTALASREQRPAALRWLAHHEFPVYRSLSRPNQGLPVLTEAVLPPKLDFLDLSPSVS
jgi:hypothetical protein